MRSRKVLPGISPAARAYGPSGQSNGSGPAPRPSTASRSAPWRRPYHKNPPMHPEAGMGCVCSHVPLQ